MDILGSIMKSMDKPPSLTEQEKLLRKKKREELEKRQNQEKENYKRFKEQIEKKLNSYFENAENGNLKFSPMNPYYRSIIHESAETAGLLSYAFGEDGVDRHVRVYRRENAPCEAELTARRRGIPWDKHAAERIRAEEVKQEAQQRAPASFTPNSNYKDKYAHLVGYEAAKKTETNHTYGFVPSANKKDVRSIEQTMADIQAKKRLKAKQS